MSEMEQKDFDQLVDEGAIDLEEGNEEAEAKALAEAKAEEEKKEAETKAGETAQELQDLKDKLQAQEIANHALTVQIGTQGAPAQAQPPQALALPNITADDLVEGDAKSFNEKIEAISTKIYEHKMAPLQQEYVKNQIATNELLAVQQSDILQKYPETLARIKSTVNPQALLNLQSWKVIESMVRDAHLEEIIQERVTAATKPAAPVTAGVGSSPEVGGGPPELSAEEKAVVDKMPGITYKSYAASKALMGIG